MQDHYKVNQYTECVLSYFKGEAKGTVVRDMLVSAAFGTKTPFPTMRDPFLWFLSFYKRSDPFFLT